MKRYQLLVTAVAILSVVGASIIGGQANALTYQNFAHKVNGYRLQAHTNRTVTQDIAGYLTNDMVSPFNWQIISNGSYRLLKNSYTGQCLDSNANKYVYTNPCSTSNYYQNWLVISNGNYILLKDRATGLCLDGNYNHTIYTNPCGRGNDYQNWY